MFARSLFGASPALAKPALAGLALAGLLGGCTTTWETPPDPRPSYLRDYIDAHYDELGEHFDQPMSLAAFAARLQQTRVLFLGDHHRDVQHHRQILDLIDWICAQGHRPVIGMEAIGSEDNPSLQEYLSGGIDLDELRRRVAWRWPASWLESTDVDRYFFRALLAQSRTRGLAAFPLEQTPRLPLLERDFVIATNVRRALRMYPDRLVIVIVGHAHLLGDGHLRGRVGADSVVIAARLSPALQRAFVSQPPTKAGFLRSNRGILFFSPSIASQITE